MNEHKVSAIAFKVMGIASIAIGGIVGTFFGSRQTKYLAYVSLNEILPDRYPMSEAPMKYDIGNGIAIFVLAAFFGLLLFGIGCMIHAQSDLLAVSKNIYTRQFQSPTRHNAASSLPAQNQVSRQSYFQEEQNV